MGGDVKGKAGRFRPRVEWWAPALIAAAALGAWEGAVHLGLVSRLFFPAPSTICRTLYRQMTGGGLATDVGTTLRRIVLGFLLGAVPGAIIGLGMGWSRRARFIADPFVAAFHPLPKVALLPLFMIVLGLGESSKLAVIGLASFFPVVINAMAGVRQISPIHFEVARNYRAGWLKVFTRVVLPGSLPMMLTGARLAFNTAVVLTIAVELVAARRGLGAVIWSAWETMRTEELYGGIVVAALLGVMFSALLRWAARRLAPWRTEREI